MEVDSSLCNYGNVILRTTITGINNFEEKESDISIEVYRPIIFC